VIKIIWDELKCEFVVVPLSVERPEETIKFKLIFIYINNITKEEVIKIHATKIGPTSIKSESTDNFIKNIGLGGIPDKFMISRMEIKVTTLLIAWIERDGEKTQAIRNTNRNLKKLYRRKKIIQVFPDENEDKTIQLRLKTDDIAITFFILVWTREWTSDSKIEATITTLNPEHGNTILIIIKGINFWGIAIQIKIGHCTLDIIEMNHKWNGAIPILAAIIASTAASNNLGAKSFIIT